MTQRFGEKVEVSGLQDEDCWSVKKRIASICRNMSRVSDSIRRVY